MDFCHRFFPQREARQCCRSIGFETRITVPFCPESRLSGVGFADFMETAWQQRRIEIPADWPDRKILLHFGGINYRSVVSLGGTWAGRHTGGVSPFAIDLSGCAEPGRVHDLVVKAGAFMRSGLQPFGSQAPFFQSAGCRYTGTTGIWQPSGWRPFPSMP